MLPRRRATGLRAGKAARKGAPSQKTCRRPRTEPLAEGGIVPSSLAARSAGVALSWSGGKDSALALLALREELRIDPCVLITTVTETYERVSMHGVRRELLVRQ